VTSTNKSDERSPDDLLDDLESIKDLLDEEDGGDQPDTDDALTVGGKSVPLLDDMVDGALKLEETSFSRFEPPLGESDSTRSRLNEDLFDALLGDEWKDSAADILTEARGAIEAHRNEWTPEDTDELNDALRVRIDATLSEWLRKTVRAHLGELRTELLHAAEAAISDRIALLSNPEHPGEDSDDHG